MGGFGIDWYIKENGKPMENNPSSETLLVSFIGKYYEVILCCGILTKITLCFSSSNILALALPASFGRHAILSRLVCCVMPRRWDVALPTSFPGSLILPPISVTPGGGKPRDPENKVVALRTKWEFSSRPLPLPICRLFDLLFLRNLVNANLNFCRVEAIRYIYKIYKFIDI